MHEITFIVDITGEVIYETTAETLKAAKTRTLEVINRITLGDDSQAQSAINMTNAYDGIKPVNDLIGRGGGPGIRLVVTPAGPVGVQVLIDEYDDIVDTTYGTRIEAVQAALHGLEQIEDDCDDIAWQSAARRVAGFDRTNPFNVHVAWTNGMGSYKVGMD